MVFHITAETKKRKGHQKLSTATQTQETRLHLVNLADELLLNITKYLTTRDLWQLRLLHSGLTAVANETLSKRLQCLYLHPSALALRKAIDISGHPFFKGNIEEIVIQGVGNTKPELLPWPAVPQLSPSSLQRKNSLHASTTTDAPTKDETWVLHPGAPAFDKAYSPLILGLSKLPLTTLTYGRTVNGNTVGTRGFNAVSKQRLLSFSEKQSKERDEMRYPDSRMLFCLLGSLQPWCGGRARIHQLVIEMPLPMLSDWATLPRAVIHAAENLTCVKLALDLELDRGFVKWTNWQAWCCSILSHAKNLETLSLTVDSASTSRQIVEQASLESLAYSCKMSQNAHCQKTQLLSATSKQY